MIIQIVILTTRVVATHIKFLQVPPTDETVTIFYKTLKPESTTKESVYRFHTQEILERTQCS